MSCTSKFALAFCFLGLQLFGVAAGAMQLRVDPAAKLQYSEALSGATIIVVENDLGTIAIREVDGNQLHLVAGNFGTDMVPVTIEQPQPDQLKIVVEYPVLISAKSNSVGSGNVNIFAGRGSRIIIGGTVVAGSFGQVDLLLAVPKSLLAHLKAKSFAGNINIRGFFAGTLSQARILDVKTSQGDIDLEYLIAVGGVTLKPAKETSLWPKSREP